MQGFPKDYIIDRDYNWKKYPIAKQVARIGNSVVPIMAQKLVEANCPYLRVGERMPNMSIDDSGDQLKFAQERENGIDVRNGIIYKSDGDMLIDIYRKVDIFTGLVNFY